MKQQDAMVKEQRRLALEVFELPDPVGDSMNATGNELVEFDLRTNEILEDMPPVARRLAEWVLADDSRNRR